MNKESEVLVEELLDHDLVVLFSDTTCINPLLSAELNFKWQPEVLIGQGYSLQ